MERVQNLDFIHLFGGGLKKIHFFKLYTIVPWHKLNYFLIFQLICQIFEKAISYVKVWSLVVLKGRYEMEVHLKHLNIFETKVPYNKFIPYLKFLELKTGMPNQETKVKLIIQHSCAKSTKVLW